MVLGLQWEAYRLAPGRWVIGSEGGRLGGETGEQGCDATSCGSTFGPTSTNALPIRGVGARAVGPHFHSPSYSSTTHSSRSLRSLMATVASLRLFRLLGASKGPGKAQIARGTGRKLTSSSARSFAKSFSHTARNTILATPQRINTPQWRAYSTPSVVRRRSKIGHTFLLENGPPLLEIC